MLNIWYTHVRILLLHKWAIIGRNNNNIIVMVIGIIMIFFFKLDNKKIKRLTLAYDYFY